jgi:hypothetical protein
MPIYRVFLKAVSLLVGVALACLGVAILTALASGDVRVGAGFASLAGTSFLAVAAPCLAYPFWPRLARFLLALVLVGFGSGMLWLAFSSPVTSSQALMFRGAAGAFCVILLLRFSLAYRRRNCLHGA